MPHLVLLWYCYILKTNKSQIEGDYKMNRVVKSLLLLLTIAFTLPISAQNSLMTPEQLAKREKRKNLTVKEWNTDAASKTRWLDHVKIYDSKGRLIEETEYASYGQRKRITSTYDDV